MVEYQGEIQALGCQCKYKALAGLQRFVIFLVFVHMILIVRFGEMCLYYLADLVTRALAFSSQRAMIKHGFTLNGKKESNKPARHWKSAHFSFQTLRGCRELTSA